MRVHEIAKELKLSTKDISDTLNALDITGKTHLSKLEEEDIKRIREHHSGVKRLTLRTAVNAPANPAPAPEPEPPEQKDEAVAEDHAEKEPDGPNVIMIKGATVMVKELATLMDVKPNVLIAELMKMNVFASINMKLEFKVAQEIAAKHGVKLEQEKKEKPPPPPRKKEVKNPTSFKEDRPEELLPRAPVVTFMGHVDHGKTSLLDKIREANVVSGEAGGITQHIGAYTVDFDDHKITFLDTPGHQAFTAMRARGAQLTDIAVLVVAADDGVMPQTREAIRHAKAANVCIIVAVNKMDLPGANPDRVKQQLMEEEVMCEDWGGDVGVCHVSAETGEGMEALLDRINLESEMMELKANPDGGGQGYVIEARLEQGMGPIATVLVKRGTLNVGDAVVIGPCWGKVKALINDKGHKVRKAGPSEAVQCMGLNKVPEAGAEFLVYPNDRAAKTEAETQQVQARTDSLKGSARGSSLEDLFAQTADSEKKELNAIVKCDVQGTLEAVQQSLVDIKSDKVAVKIILSSVGNVNENDVLLAKASNAMVLGFHVGKEPGVDRMAKHEGVEIRLYSIIYELIDDIRRSMTGMIDPEYVEKITGRAEIRQVFDIGKRSRIAGCMVVQGRINSKSKARVFRNDELLYTGTMASLKRFQNDASEVREGQECGIGLDNFKNIEVGDIIECYNLNRIEQEL